MDKEIGEIPVRLAKRSATGTDLVKRRISSPSVLQAEFKMKKRLVEAREIGVEMREIGFGRGVIHRFGDENLVYMEIYGYVPPES
jgi:hypothetical protein